MIENLLYMLLWKHRLKYNFGTKKILRQRPKHYLQLCGHVNLLYHCIHFHHCYILVYVSVNYYIM